jgi:uncharacterized membrane protein YdjX (TVP38/TMEM64 family)
MTSSSKRWLVGGSLLVGAIALLITLGRFLDVPIYLKQALIWIKGLGWWAPIVFIAIYNLATITFVPGSLLTLGGGAIFGVFWGSVYVFVAATLGATIAFLIGRYFTHSWVEEVVANQPKFRAISQAVAQAGFKIVLLTRLSPVFPFNLLNYAFGVTQVSLRDYVLGSVGMIPGTIMYVYLGSLIGDLTQLGTTNPTNGWVNWAIRIVGFTTTVVVTVYVTKLAKQALESATGAE